MAHFGMTCQNELYITVLAFTISFQFYPDGSCRVDTFFKNCKLAGRSSVALLRDRMLADLPKKCPVFSTAPKGSLYGEARFLGRSGAHLFPAQRNLTTLRFVGKKRSPVIGRSFVKRCLK